MHPPGCAELRESRKKKRGVTCRRETGPEDGLKPSRAQACPQAGSRRSRGIPILPPSLPPSAFYLQPGASQRLGSPVAQQHPARGWPAWPGSGRRRRRGDAALAPCGFPAHRGDRKSVV